MYKKIFLTLAIVLCVSVSAFAAPVKDNSLSRTCNPSSWTDLGDGIVRDDLTGLEWAPGNNLMESRDPDFDDEGTPGDGQVTWQTAVEYIEKLNSENYLGYSDWRLPGVKELISRGIGGSSETAEPYHWSSTDFAGDSDMAWCVGYINHFVYTYLKSALYYVRAVRGGPLSTSNFIDNADGTITDTDTGLMWQKETSPGPNSMLPLLEDYIISLNDQNYLGYSDWREPHINEVQSIVDYSLNDPAIDTAFFPDTETAMYWTYTPYTDHLWEAFSVQFATGEMFPYDIFSTGFLRMVRGGLCRVDGDWCIDNSDCAEGYECVDGSCMLIPQPGSWTWMSGSDIALQDGVYGTKGIPDAANVPGARHASISWIGSAGNLWLFGGHVGDPENEYDIERQGNDLWRFDIATGEWTWMSGASTLKHPGTYGTMGVSDAVNVPGARTDGISWTDSAGNLWLFGGAGYDSARSWGSLNDLWRYDPDINEWTWMSGSNSKWQPGVYGEKGVPDAANVPGARGSSISWIDSADNLWLFGGSGFDGTGGTGDLNDLWCYKPDTGLWTWMSGSDTSNQTGVYGTQGVAHAANMPRGGDSSISWTDSAGNLWLFGGGDHYSRRNDLWRYEPDTGLWTWMSGSDTSNQAGVYGTKGIPDAANIPGARYDSISWTDNAGNFWLLGGGGSGDWPVEILNDLWCYSPDTGLWVWVRGSNTGDQTGVYGAKGVPDAANVPGARMSSISWIDTTGNLWMFGGSNLRYMDYCFGVMNDLWRYEVPPLCAIDNDCPEGYECFYGTCAPILDDPPVIVAGPFLAGGSWTVLPTSSESPMVLTQNENVLWTFSDDYAACSEDCTHVAEYQAVGAAGWAALSVTSDDAQGYALVALPIDSLLNATTYAFRFSITDCANQSAQSQTYYFRVATEDDPPAIDAGPFLAGGSWTVLPTTSESPMVLTQNENVLWIFSDDKASCSEDCTHTAKYQKIGDSEWIDLTVTSDSAEGFALVSLPIEQLKNATYAFQFSVTDCAALTTQSEIYYFEVDRPDQPPEFLSEPRWVGAWTVMSADASAPDKPQSENVVFYAYDDDGQTCQEGNHSETLWMYRSVELQQGEVVPLGDWSTEVPSRSFLYWVLIEEPTVAGTAGPGLFEFKIILTDCIGQTTNSEDFFGKRYYFQVD